MELRRGDEAVFRRPSLRPNEALSVNLGKHIKANWLGLLAVALLLAIGLVNLASADYYSGDQFHRAEMIWVVLAILVATVVAVVDIRLFERFADIGYVLLVGMLVLTALIGREIYGSTRWLHLGGMVVQPSELMKIGLILALARFIHRTKGAEKYQLRTLIKPFLLILAPCVLVIAQPDLGTALVLVLIAATMLFFEGIHPRTLLMLVGIVGMIVPIAWQYDLIERYQKDRVVLWLMEEELDPGNPDDKRILDKNLQSEQALWAIGSGRLTGKGLRQGTRSRLKYLPETHNDFIIAIFAEEQGFMGCMGLTALFYAILLWAFRVARGAREKFGALVAVGVASMVMWQFFINVGMVTGMLPVVGLPLPFLSYGGSSLVTTLIGVGLIVNVSVSRVRIV